MRLFRRKPRLRTLGEAEAYERTYGDRTDAVRTVERVPFPPPRKRHHGILVQGEKLRRAFSERLERRQMRPPSA